MSTPTSTQTQIPDIVEKATQDAVEKAAKKIVEEVLQLYKSFKTTKERGAAKKLIDINRVPTTYCYAYQIDFDVAGPISPQLMIKCEISLTVSDSGVEDTSNVKTAKEHLLDHLLEIIKH